MHLPTASATDSLQARLTGPTEAEPPPIATQHPPAHPHSPPSPGRATPPEEEPKVAKASLLHVNRGELGSPWVLQEVLAERTRLRQQHHLCQWEPRRMLRREINKQLSAYVDTINPSPDLQPLDIRQLDAPSQARYLALLREAARGNGIAADELAALLRAPAPAAAAVPLPAVTAAPASRPVRECRKRVRNAPGEPSPQDTKQAAAQRGDEIVLVSWHPHWCYVDCPLGKHHKAAFDSFRAHDIPRALRTVGVRRPLFPWPRNVPRVDVDVAECHPDGDVQLNQPAACLSLDGEHALFHDALGKFRGRTTLANAKDLWSRYSRQHGRGASFTHFCEQMCSTFRLYKEQTKSSIPGHAVRLKNNWATPAPVVAALHRLLGSISEKFASPLNVHSASKEFWTAQSSDSAFGARLDAYSSPWAGNLLVNPEYEDEALCRAVQWALASIHTDVSTPSCFIFVVPAWANKKYHKLLVESHCATLLSRVASGAFHFHRADYQYDPEKLLGRSRPGCSWPVELWLLANSAGLSKVLAGAAMNELHAALLSACKPGTHPTSVLTAAQAAAYAPYCNALLPAQPYSLSVTPAVTLTISPPASLIRALSYPSIRGGDTCRAAPTTVWQCLQSNHGPPRAHTVR